MEVNGLPRLDRAFVQDPHTLYRRLRADAPVHPVVMWGGARIWLVTRYSDARTLLNSPRLSEDLPRALALLPPDVGAMSESPLNLNLLMRDPPDHTRLRRLVVKAFTARATERLRPQIERITDELLDGVEILAAEGAVDLMKLFGATLPVRVRELLGVEWADREKFRAAIGPAITTTDPDESRTAMAALTTLLTGLIASKRARPADDLLSALIRVSDRGERLSEDELLAMTYLLILAGHETTVNLICNGILGLLHNPSQLGLLRANPSRISGAVEEFLRYGSPLNIATARFTTEAIRVSDIDIPADELVMIALLAANHDGDRSTSQISWISPERPMPTSHSDTESLLHRRATSAP